ncbi:glycosyltransferase [Hyphodiscus hymeniophilus]|uniref:Glycosyltransferase n=1 Tax=Hyphodiscus hymeniophilus TaxID=353542 RepID=A0A9P6VCL5_9HELO|nr:glycosyltransferase [Hyphodiscus hymeniophilus]
MSNLVVPNDHSSQDSGMGKVTISATRSSGRRHSTASAFVLDDGRVDVRLTAKAAKLTHHLETRAIKRLHFPMGENLTRNNKHYDTQFQSILGKFSGSIPRLNIAIHIVGSRGDVQPFVAIGQVLQKPPYSHRIRICTHPVFKDFVEENGLEFFSIGGDPATLMAYMVKNPGLMPGKESWKAGDVGKRRADIAQILEGCWRGCIEPGDGMGGVTKDATGNLDADSMFIADAIIANPPSYGHIHCAEKLGIPLHMMFTPLWGHMLLSRMKVPFTYAWSSALIPKPPDWGSYINISGFAFLSAPSTYKPPEDLMAFLNAGPRQSTLDLDQFAIKRAGVRALVSKGWGGLGGGEPPEGVFLLGNCPHDWLFNYVSAVVHHGGAGTTAIGIAMGKPTVVVPFFGDQPFWGAMIYRSGAGPEPVPYKKMTAEILAESITKALGPEIQTAVKEMSKKIANEHGAADAAASFHQAVNMDSMRCLLLPDRVAVWRIKKTDVRLSDLAAATLIDKGYLTLNDLKLVKHRDWYIDEGASNPVFGAVASVSGTLTNTIVLVSKYTKEVHQTMHKKDGERSSVSTPSESDEPEPQEWDLSKLTSRNPVSNAIRYRYPPQHLEMLAYQMASKTLPRRNKRAKSSRTSHSSPLQVDHIFHRSPTTKSLSSKATKHEHGKLHEASSETGHLTVSLVEAGLKAPVAFFYQLANGFHNAPSFIFHDDTVRRRDNITGFGSGVKVAAKGFTYNLLDGVTGLVYQPYHCAQTDGLGGFGKGIGKGVGGLVFKITAAVLGVPAYTMKGLEKQFEKRHNRALKAKILEVRLRQGLVAYRKATEEEKTGVVRRWKEMGYVRRFGIKDWAIKEDG